MPQVVCFGNPVYDLISTPSVKSSDRLLSGCSTNACLALSRLGSKGFLVGNVGNDFLSRLENDLSKRGVDFKLYFSAQTGGFQLEYYDDKGNRHLSILGIAGEIVFEVIPELKRAKMVLLGPILGELSANFGWQLKKYINAPLFLDPQGTLRKVKNGKIVHELTEDFRELAKISTIVKANELETEVVTGIQPRRDPYHAVELLHQFGAKVSILTLAEAGSIIYDGKSFIEIPPFSTLPVDPTGAGDTYAAGFIYKYINNPRDLFSAGCFGSAVASIMVESTGPDFPLTLDAAEKRAAILMTESLGLNL